MRIAFLIFSFLFLISTGYSQKSKNIDSLRALVASAPDDTTLIRETLRLSNALRRKHPEEARKNAQKALELAEKIKHPLGISAAYNFLSIMDNAEGKYAEAIDCNRKAIPYQIKIKDDFGLSRSYNGLGTSFYMTYNLDSCINYFLLATKLAEKLNEITAMKSMYSNLAVVLSEKGTYDKSLEFYQKAVKLEKQQNDIQGMAESYINIGVLYTKTNKDSLAMRYLDDAFKTFTELGDTLRLIDVYVNYSTLYEKQKRLDKSLSVLKTALNYGVTINSEEAVANCNFNIADCYRKLNDPVNAEQFYLAAIPVCEKLGLKKLLMESYDGLAWTFMMKKNYKSAFDYKEKYVAIKDSVDKEKYSETMLELETKFDVSRKEAEISLLNKDKLVKDAELDKRKGWISFFAVLVIAFLILSLIIFRSNINRKKANLQLLKLNKEINNSKTEVEHQKEIVEEKQKEIMDSIIYAKRIQYTLLANNELMKANLPEHFVYFKPKDIVSGDFYWATKKDDLFYLAVCDSTGHGVPGAFMSLLNINFLNEAVSEKDIKAPNEILEHVRRRLIASMDGGQDGMDAILICIDTAKNNITYAAANNEPIVVKNAAYTELQKDKMPVGKGIKDDKFTLFTIDVQKGDSIYLYTDGYADQFGGPKGKKFKYKELNELLLANNTKPFNEQAELLDKRFIEWKGHMEQVDDVCIIGIKI